MNRYLIGFISTLLLLVFGTAELLAESHNSAKPDNLTEVRVRITVIDIDDVKEAEQTFTVNFVYEARWNDPALVHDESKGTVTYKTSEVWHPRLQIVNQQRAIRTMPEVVTVEPNGDARYMQRIWGPMSQPLSLRKFPFDTQIFEIILLAAGGAGKVELVRNKEEKSGIAEKLSLPDWSILGWSVKEDIYSPMEDFVKLPTLSFQIKARRKSGYFVLNVIFPLILIVMMSWVVFWIDPTESGTQIGVAMTSMLTLIAYRFAVGNDLPEIAYLSRMDLFIMGSTFLVFLTLLEALYTGNLAKKGKNQLAIKVDYKSRFIFPVLLVGLCVFAFMFF